MVPTTQGDTMVNPRIEDEELFKKVIENIERINDLREESLRAIINIKDSALRKVAQFTFEMPHEPTAKF